MPVVYKIGDLGHVMHVDEPLEAEGDSRYLPKEILAEELDHLPKADIFALGLTLYEMMSCKPLPANGTEWHVLRNGSAPTCKAFSVELNTIVARMIHPDPASRPSAEQLVNHPLVVAQHRVPTDLKTREELVRELHAEKLRAAQLFLQLKAAEEERKAAQEGGDASHASQATVPSMVKHRKSAAPSVSRDRDRVGPVAEGDAGGDTSGTVGQAAAGRPFCRASSACF